MGRYIKNFETPTNAYALRVPVGSSLVAPDSPVDGQVRFNAESGTIEYYADFRWNTFSRTGVVDVVKDEFVGDDITFTFPMSQPYLPGRETDILVFIGNVFQNPGVSYTVSDYDITFTSIPNPDQPIVVLHNFNSTKAT